MSEKKEAYLELECRLVKYLVLLQGAVKSPIAGPGIYEGHSEQDLDNIAEWISVNAERADTQMYEGLEIVDFMVMVCTQGDDTALAVHNARVSGIKAVFNLSNLPTLKAAINAAPGFGLTGIKKLKPPLEDGYNEDKKQRQALFRFQAICGIEL